MSQRECLRSAVGNFSGSARRRDVKPRERRRLDLEPLEPRRLLASISEITVPSGLAAGPDRITAGPGDTLWFTEYNSGQIGVVDAATQKVTEFPLTERNSQPFDITTASNGTIWFTEFTAGQIGTINPSTDKITQYPLSDTEAEPYDITAGPAGSDTVWFTEWNGNQIGEVNVNTGAITEFPIPTSDAEPEGITVGPGGNIWFTEAMAGKIGMFDPATEQFTEYQLAASTSQPDGIAAGPGGIWFTEYAGNQIGLLNPVSGAVVTTINIPVARSQPTTITVGPDGYLWFTEPGSSQIGILNPSTQAITELGTPTTAAGPRGLTTGPDGKVWFAELSTGKVGVVTPDLNVVLTSSPPAQLTAGTTFGLTATIEYDSGVVDTHYTGNVAVTGGDGSLGGTLTVPATGGVATFSGLTLGSAGTAALQLSAVDAPCARIVVRRRHVSAAGGCHHGSAGDPRESADSGHQLTDAAQDHPGAGRLRRQGEEQARSRVRVSVQFAARCDQCR